MRLTRESEYALLGLASLAARPRGAVVSTSEIAEAERLPASFLAKIFQKVARHGLLTGARGPGSGYMLARPANSITLREILESVEGPGLFECCLLWTGCSHGTPCPLHAVVEPILSALAVRLESITLADYAESLDHQHFSSTR